MSCCKRESLDITETRSGPSSDATAPSSSGSATHHSGTVSGSVITFHDIHYSVQVKNPDKRCCGQMTKEILKGVSGIFKPGMNAILGPTGCGKSSLLDILAGRKDPAGLTGHILVDGHRQPKNFKCVSGYVVQDDVVLGTLTVRENMMFSANVRLPESIPYKEKEKRVEDSICELGLESCADTKVGNEFIRGVSGGERKRTNIGMELIISPSVLFLDEPTTGLDAHTASTLCRILYGLSRRGRTVIFSIHQPRYAIYRLFDSLMVLGQGRTAYHGPAQEALEFFDSMGYKCETFNNPSDFFLDVMQGQYEPDAADGQEADAEQESPANGTGTTEVVVEMARAKTTRSYESKSALYNKIADTYGQSRWRKELDDELDPILKEHQNKSNTIEEPPYATSLFTQFRHLSVRFLMNLFRHPQLSVMQWIMMCVFALVVGIIYFDVDDTYPNGIQNRSGAIFFITMNVVLVNINALEVFIKERALFLHENVSGFYRVSAYFFGKLLCDLLPMRLIPIVPYSLIAYFMIGFDPDVLKFLFFLMHMLLVSFTATCMAFLISAHCRLLPVGIMLMAGLFILMMVFGGLFFNVTDITPVLRWLQYLSIFRYTLKALSINEMKDMTYCYTNNGTQCFEAGNAYMDEQGIDYETTWDLWQNEMALGILMLVSLTLTYIKLLRMPKLK